MVRIEDSFCRRFPSLVLLMHRSHIPARGIGTRSPFHITIQQNIRYLDRTSKPTAMESHYACPASPVRKARSLVSSIKKKCSHFIGPLRCPAPIILKLLGLSYRSEVKCIYELRLYVPVMAMVTSTGRNSSKLSAARLDERWLSRLGTV